MNILMTGASGYIGQRLLLVAQNYLSDSDNIILLTSNLIKGYKCIKHKLS